MEFTLYYRGTLRAASAKNKRKGEKHALRKHFHKQLKELWKQLPLSEHREFLDPENTTFTKWKDEEESLALEEEQKSVISPVGKFRFASTISSQLNMVADLRITMLRPEEPGNIVSQGGDIDNRLKTLLDALRAPMQPDDLPNDAVPSEDESPFFCLVEDDNLITSLDIKTAQWLDPSADQSEVVLLIDVRTRLLRPIIGTVGLA